MMYGLAGPLMISFGLLILLAVLLAPVVERMLFGMGDAQRQRLDRPRVRKLINRQKLLARRENALTKTADLELDELIHAGELEQALMLARERMHEMHLQGRAEPEALYRRYIVELSARLEQDGVPPR